jgi:hypothetical protein
MLRRMKRFPATVLSILGVLGPITGCSKTDRSSTETTSASSAASAASAASIPTTPLAGQLGGQPFTLKKISMVTAKGFGEWRLSIEGSTPNAETAAIRLPVRAALGAGKTAESGATGLTPGAARAFAINVQNGPSNTTSTSASYRLEITKWDVKPCPTDMDPTHEGGLASGRILVKVPGEKVEVAGTFTDAVVKYGQTPDWDYR